MSGSPPTTLGKYQIIREIARSNDIVYEAYDPLMNRRVALKELAVPGGTTGQQKEDRVKRFLREARAAGSLAHPNIMTVYEVGQEGDRYFIAMEYLDGKTLRNELDTKGFLPPEKATEIAKAVLEGLEYAHTKGVIHRDIKPDNIQLLTSGAVKVTDFGIARLTFEPNLTMDGQVFGTPSYMSPEQVVGRDIDARSDLFSVGVVLYEMLSGGKPFPGDSVVTITYSIMNRNPDRPQHMNWALWQVVERALDKSPQLRYRGAREFIEAIDEAMHASAGNVIDPRATAYGPPPVAQSPYGQSGAYGNSQYIAPPPTYTGYQQNPYTNIPVVQPPYVPGISQQQQPQQQQQATPVVPPAYGQQVPVYYPPPPRKPLVIMSAQAKLMLANVILYTLALVVGGAAVFKLVDAMTSFDSGAPAQAPASRSGTVKRVAQAQPDDGFPQLLQEGLVAQNNGDYDTAEGSYKKAISLRPGNPLGYSRLGDLFSEKAQHPEDRSHEEDYISHAADSYEMAAAINSDSNLSLEAAKSFYLLALLDHEDLNDRDARQMLYKALQHAHSDPQETSLITAELNRLSGSD